MARSPAVATFLGPAVLAVACFYGEAHGSVKQIGSFCLGLSLVLALIWVYSFWALHVARPLAPVKKQISASSRKVSLEWSASDDFEDFAPLLALKQLDFTGENITGALVQELRLDLEATLQAGSHELKISERTGLQLNVTDKMAKQKCKLLLEAKPPSPQHEAVASSLLFHLPGIQLRGVAAALDGLWELWANQGAPTASSSMGSCLRWIAVLLLQLLEVALPISLHTVEGAAVGQEFLLFFTGAVGFIPFERVHLPAFVLPRLHAPLSGLLSANPLVGQRIRKSASPPVAHPGLLAAWKLSADVSILPFGLDVMLRMRDGSISAFQGMLLSEDSLRARCESSGSLDKDKLKIEVDSFSVTSAGAGDGRDKGIGGSASIEVGLGIGMFFTQKSPKVSLPDLFFSAASGHALRPGSLDFRCKVNLAQNSELPEPLRVTFRDEHPLMLGSANVAARLQRLALKGSLSLQQTLPMQRKRDLLQLPQTNLSFETSLELEEETSFMDDGFSTIRFQGVQCSAEGRLWSEGQECLMAKALVQASGFIAAQFRAASLVQALIEAETAAARLSGSSPNKGQSESTGDEEGQYTSVRVGDVLQVDVGGSAKVIGHAQLRLNPTEPKEPVLERSLSPVSRGRVEAEKLTVADIADDDGCESIEGEDRMPLLRVSIAGSEASIEMGECRAQVGDLALTIPKAQMKVDAIEAEINAEGIGQTHLRLTWDGLGQPLLQHTAKQRSVLFPQPPSSSGLKVEIGDMGQVGIALDDEPDMAACGNRLLDDETWFTPLLELAAILNLEATTKRLLNFARVVRNVMRSEDITEPKDVIPTGRMARVIARILQEIGTDGQHVADAEPTRLEQDIYGVVEGAVGGKGLDVTRITRLLWDHLPSEACSFVQEYTAEVDFAIKWFDSVLKPTEPTSGPDPGKATEAPPSQKFRRELQEVAPCASRLYEAVARPGQLSRQVEEQLLRAAPYLTGKQVEHLLRHANVGVTLRQRLKFLLGLKRRVEKVAQGYGGPAFMPQGMAVGFFLATAIRASFAGVEKTASSQRLLSRSTEEPKKASTRLAGVLREQRAVAQELSRLQERQRLLLEEALILSGLEQRSASDPKLVVDDTPCKSLTPNENPSSMSSMLSCLALPAAAPAAAVVSANAAYAQRLQAPKPEPGTGTSSTGSASVVRSQVPHELFDLGSSLLGPMEVAILLQSGLAAVPQGRQVQQNQRMLLEMMVSQPPLFLKGVLYELSNNGSARVLGNHLMALLDLTQDAIRPNARLDVADLLTQALGVSMPRRSDFMAGGSSASRSYLLLVHRAAKHVLEECGPYVALKHWLQRSEVPLPAVRDVPMPSAERAIAAAQHAIEVADAAGDEWLKVRGAPWYDGALEDSSPAEPKEEQLRNEARKLYTMAFEACAMALKGSQEVLHQEWFQTFWARNYDALTVVSVLQNVQMDVDKTRKWVDGQLRHGTSTSTDYKGVREACDALWQKNPRSEACLVDCLIEILFYDPADRLKYRKDALMQLIIEEPPGHLNFTVVSAMGVITEGAKGTEMAATYARLRELRGVEVVRADTATLQSVDYNAACVEKTVKEVSTPWGWVGYSQGCANAFRAESMMLQGTPEQQRLMSTFRCRQLLFSAANGSAHATCGDWKLLRALVDGERFLKRFQASMSAATQNLALDLLQNALSSRLAYAVLGSVQSLTHEGARTMWRDGQHAHAPSTSMRGVVESHTLPECLMFVSNIILQQMDYSQRQDTQVAVEEAVAYPTSIRNANAELLKRVDMRSAIQRTHHWSPLHEEVLFLTTSGDDPLAMFDTPKDRHVFPWLEVNTRFGVIQRKDECS